MSVCLSGFLSACLMPVSRRWSASCGAHVLFCVEGSEAARDEGDVYRLSWGSLIRRAGGGGRRAGDEYVVTGLELDPSSADAVRVAVTWVVGLGQAGCLEGGLWQVRHALDRFVLRPSGVAVCLRRRGVWQANEELAMTVTGCSSGITGDSLGVPAALALLAFRLGLQPRPAGSEVAVTGALDLAGRVRPVGGLRGKLQVRDGPPAAPSACSLVAAAAWPGRRVARPPRAWLTDPASSVVWHWW